MLPDLSFLLALILGLFALEPPGDRGPSALFAAGGTAAVVLVVAALARMAADRAVRAAEETDPAGVLIASRRMAFLPILGWAVALAVFRWGSFVAGAVPPTWFFAPYLLLFLPLFLLFGSAWASARQVEAHLSPKAPSTWGAIARALRRNLVVLAPLGILLAVSDLVRVLAAAGIPGIAKAMAWHEAYPDLAAAAMVVMLFGLGLLAPWIFRRSLRATPIPPGDLRKSLEGLAKAIGLRVRDFLLWDTHGRVANAMVVGITPGTRYVFLTDGLLAALTPAEVAAVVAHEAGHAKERHLPLYFLVGISLLLLSKALEEASSPVLDAMGQLWTTLALLFLFWFVVLGWLSRRFETEADAFGADHGGALEPGAPPVETAGVDKPVPYGAALMMAVLRRLERITGPVRHHRHAPPAERVAFLAQYATDPAAREAFRRQRRATRLGVFGLLGLALAVTAWRLPAGLERGRVRLARMDGERTVESAAAARKRGDEPATMEALRRARATFLDAAAAAERSPRDEALALDGAIAAYDAGDLDRRRLGDPAAARDELARALKITERVRDPRIAAQLRFHGHVDLGLLAFAGPPDDKAAVATAREHLDAAKAVPENEFGGALRRARTRLLESAIRAREGDPSRSAQARTDLEGLSKSGGDGEEWQDLRDDAAEQLRLALR